MDGNGGVDLNHFFVVCDQERAYVDRLTEAINTRKLVPYPVEGMTSVEDVRSFCEGHRVALLLIENELADARAETLPVDCMVRLCSVPGQQSPGVVFKYQPMPQLMRQVLKAQCESTEEIAQPGNMTVMGVYSPGQCVQTTPFALALAQLLAKEQRVLYLNFRPFVGLAKLLGEPEETDLSDAFYLLGQGEVQTGQWQPECVRKIEDLEYILPAASPDDLRGIGEAETGRLLQGIRETGQYETVILEVGDVCAGFFSLLAACHTVYMPVSEDCCFTAQLQQYETLLTRRGYAGILKKTVPVKPPQVRNVDGSRFAEHLLWGEVGDYVRTLLWGKRS